MVHILWEDILLTRRTVGSVSENGYSPSHSPRLFFQTQVFDTNLGNMVNVPTVNRVKRGLNA